VSSNFVNLALENCALNQVESFSVEADLEVDLEASFDRVQNLLVPVDAWIDLHKVGKLALWNIDICFVLLVVLNKL